jgi:hypothetical protein
LSDVDEKSNIDVLREELHIDYDDEINLEYNEKLQLKN